MKPLLLLILIMLTAPLFANEALEQIKKEVWDTEMAFAKTMEDRDHEAFKSFLAEDVVFLGGKSATRGKQAVADKWAKYFVKEKATFAWKPEKVEVLENGTLALSSGPVWDHIGRYQTYTSIWRKEKSGKWKVVFDKGDRYCPKEKKAKN